MTQYGEFAFAHVVLNTEPDGIVVTHRSPAAAIDDSKKTADFLNIACSLPNTLAIVVWNVVQFFPGALQLILKNKALELARPGDLASRAVAKESSVRLCFMEAWENFQLF